MKHFIALILVAFLAFTVNPTQTVANNAIDQTSVVISADNHNDNCGSFTDIIIPQDNVISGMPELRKSFVQSNVVISVGDLDDNYSLYADASVPQGTDVVSDSDSPEPEKLSIIQWVSKNFEIILALALALSEVLALIPGISQNGIFQTIFSWLKARNAKKSGKSTS